MCIRVNKAGSVGEEGSPGRGSKEVDRVEHDLLIRRLPLLTVGVRAVVTPNVANARSRQGDRAARTRYNNALLPVDSLAASFRNGLVYVVHNALEHLLSWHLKVVQVRNSFNDGLQGDKSGAVSD